MSSHPPILSRTACREIDQYATIELGIPGIVLMEHAAIGLARVAAALISEPRVLVVCGAGNNGGDGYAAARLLHNIGRDVTIARFVEPRPDSDAAVNARICERLQINCIHTSDVAVALNDCDGVIDAIFGTGLDRDVTGDQAHLIATINAMCGDEAAVAKPVIAADVPSGLDCERGVVLGEAIRATATVTFVGPTPGLLVEAAAAYVGQLYVASIGLPPCVAAERGRPMTSQERERCTLLERLPTISAHLSQ